MPYALLIFLMSVYYYSDVVMVERMRGNIEAANYAHGYRFFMAFNMLGYLFAGLLLPIFSKLIKKSKMFFLFHGCHSSLFIFLLW